MKPVFEPAIGAINGTNKNFSVSADYRPGTLRVWRNGLLMRSDLEDGWTETGPKTFQMTEAPEAEDQIMVYFIPVL